MPGLSLERGAIARHSCVRCHASPEGGMREIAGLVGVVLLVSPAGAAELVSEFSEHYINNCTMLYSQESGQVAACPGLRGYPVMILEGDMKLFVSFGFN